MNYWRTHYPMHTTNTLVIIITADPSMNAHRTHTHTLVTILTADPCSAAAHTHGLTV